MIKVTTVDFETTAIAYRPHYPPTPVGVAIRREGEPSVYLAWGHAQDNNCSKEQARLRLTHLWRSKEVLLFHNAKFDLEVAEAFTGELLPWHRFHDTMLLLFLDDPYQGSLGLKAAVKTYLQREPEEQSRIRDWLITHDIVTAKDSGWGAHIAEAPVALVAPYAISDVDTTHALFQVLYSKIAEKRMLAAYKRELQLLPILMKAEQRGVRLDVEELSTDARLYEDALISTDETLRQMLNRPNLNFNSSQELSAALDESGAVSSWGLTPTGKRSVSKTSLTLDKFTKPDIGRLLMYRDKLHTCLSTFIRPWLDQTKHGVRIYPSWNQVLNSHGRTSSGTRTGRLSSNHPNLQNLPRKFDPQINVGAVPLPNLRRYLLPEEGEVICHRDYDQQELRILAHFCGTDLCTEYLKNPDFDIHARVQDAIYQITGKSLTRSEVKILNFGTVYGMGLVKMADALNLPLEDTKLIRNAQIDALLGLKSLNHTIKMTVREGLPIRTWGGREYYVESPKLVGERIQTFDYKLLNYLIQGSAADCTKQALINYSEHKKDGQFMITVHDEINISCPPDKVESEMKILRECMQIEGFRVPMLSAGKTGINWGELTSVKD